MKIEWNGFLQEVVKPERSKRESCAWIFSSHPFCDDDVWYITDVRNVGLKDKGVQYSFAPDKKDFHRVKREATSVKLTRIGNVHTHNIISHDAKGLDGKELMFQSVPSDTDLKYARRFNDAIRGIIIVYFPSEVEFGAICNIVWHDQYGTSLDHFEAKVV